MNCDQAFEVMTSPAKTSRAALAGHLSDCPRCRQMYETLQPALGVLQLESPTPLTKSRSLTPQGSSVRLATRIADRLRRSRAAEHRPPVARRHGLAFGVSILAGFLLAVGLAQLLPRAASAPPVPAQDCVWLNPQLAEGGSSAAAVVTSCVHCHLSRGEGQPGWQGACSSRLLRLVLTSCFAVVSGTEVACPARPLVVPHPAIGGGPHV
jgi:hypothetical protein